MPTHKIPVVQRAQDLTGLSFGKLTAVKRVHNSNSGAAQWQCDCVCGRNAIVRSDNLKSRKVASCGCTKPGPKTKAEKHQAIAADEQLRKATGWPGASPVNEFVRRILVEAYDSDMYVAGGKRSYGFGHARGVDMHDCPLGGSPEIGLLTKCTGRIRLQGPINILAKRSMDMLFDAGVIPPQGTRSYTQWMIDAGVEFRLVLRADTNDIGYKYTELGGVHKRMIPDA